MKQFQKWLKEESIKSGYFYDEEAERQRKKGWRGALECVKGFADSETCARIDEELKD